MVSAGAVTVLTTPGDEARSGVEIFGESFLGRCTGCHGLPRAMGNELLVEADSSDGASVRSACIFFRAFCDCFIWNEATRSELGLSDASPDSAKDRLEARDEDACAMMSFMSSFDIIGDRAHGLLLSTGLCRGGVAVTAGLLIGVFRYEDETDWPGDCSFFPRLSYH